MCRACDRAYDARVTPALRVATVADAPAIGRVMKRSARALSAGFYDAVQTESVERHVATLDLALVTDGTYFVADGADGELACAGGWSRRDRLYTGNDVAGDARLLDPAREPARVRAMFVDPAWARRGLGRAILDRCEAAARAEGFTAVELMATLPGEPLYAACGYVVVERTELVLPDGVRIGAARMRRELTATTAG
jgi:GNAT superfamily N-acetyltransferase